MILEAEGGSKAKAGQIDAISSFCLEKYPSHIFDQGKENVH